MSLAQWWAALLICSGDPLVTQWSHYPWDVVEYGEFRIEEINAISRRPYLIIDGETVGQVNNYASTEFALACAQLPGDDSEDIWLLRLTDMYDDPAIVGWISLQTIVFSDGFE